VKLAKRYGVVGLRNAVNTCRVILKYASDNRLIDTPVNYGQAFDRPSAKTLRKARNAAGPRLFEADEIRRILAAADPTMRAMILLGCNCGFGNSDIANLTQSALNLESGRVDFPRVKTEIPRRVPRWPETVAALQDAIKARPKPATRDEAGLCFLTIRGKRWVRTQQSRKTDRLIPRDVLSQKFAKLLKRLEIYGRQGLGFYTLRHNFQTIGDAKDPEAMAALMGHVDSSMGAVTRERIPEERLQAVVDVVRAWPGNIRQLINAIERAKILADGHVITLHDLPSEITESASADAKNHDEGTLAAIERAFVLEMRDQERGHKTRTAKT